MAGQSVFDKEQIPSKTQRITWYNLWDAKRAWFEITHQANHNHLASDPLATPVNAASSRLLFSSSSSSSGLRSGWKIRDFQRSTPGLHQRRINAALARLSLKLMEMCVFSFKNLKKYMWKSRVMMFCMYWMITKCSQKLLTVFECICIITGFASKNIIVRPSRYENSLEEQADQTTKSTQTSFMFKRPHPVLSEWNSNLMCPKDSKGGIQTPTVFLSSQPSAHIWLLSGWVTELFMVKRDSSLVD